MRELKSLKPRHYEMIRLAALGVRQTDIAKKIGITDAALSCILNGTLAQAELSKLKAEMDANIVEVVDRASAIMEATQAAAEAVRINRAMLNDPLVDVKIKARVGMHFMDRILFDRQSDDSQQASYRDILRAVRNVEDKLSRTTIIAEGVVINE